MVYLDDYYPCSDYHHHHLLLNFITSLTLSNPNEVHEISNRISTSFIESVPYKSSQADPFSSMSDTTLEKPDYQTLMKGVLQDFSIPEKLTRRKHRN